MEFDKAKVYTALNADELKVCSKVIIGNTIEELRNRVQNGTTPLTLSEIRSDRYEKRFKVEEYKEDSVFSFIYLISEPEEKKLKWTDLKLGDVIKQKYSTISYLVTGIDSEGESGSHILVGKTWIEDVSLCNWVKVEE